MASLLITNTMDVNEGTACEQDVLIRNGRIEVISPDLTSRNADTIIDAAGLILMLGMIDDQVNFRGPGMPNKADIISESRTAVGGSRLQLGA